MADAPDTPDPRLPLLQVQLIRAWPDRHELRSLQLPAGSTVADALAAAGPDWQAAAQTADGLAAVGIWGRRVEPGVALSDGDRIELYRPLTADPKLARQRRASEQGYRWQGRTRRAVRTARDPG